MTVINSILNLVNFKRIDQIDYFRKNPIIVQDRQFSELVKFARNTEYGKKYNFSELKSYEKFRNQVPLNDYNSLKPYINRILEGEQNVLWPTDINWFAKSSGTTSDRSKFIPISKESLEDCHFKSGKDIYLIYIDQKPDTKVFSGKTLALGGSHQVNNFSEKSFYGDLSAVIIRNLPFWTYFHKVPSQDIALMEEWEEKLERIVDSTIKNNVTNLVGVPSWFIVLLKRVLEKTGKAKISEVWPNLELFVHGGVSFTPYRNLYNDIIGKSDMNYLETYNASEGFFGIQDDPATKDMLLMLDYGVFYEFIPADELDKDEPNTIPLAEVKTGVNYAIVITTNTGLWRYKIGDTIKFTSKNPYKFKVTGRTKHFINAFGEELIIDDAEEALDKACKATGATIRDYTAAPVYFDDVNKNAAHQWLFEFINKPDDLKKFKSALDESLRKINSDYDAKRYKDITLGPPEIVVLKEGSFYNWLKSKNKLGGQNKIPRLANHRDYVDKLLKMQN